MTVTRTDIEKYLGEVKDAIRSGRYTIARNSRRQDNINVFVDYILDEAEAQRILLSLDTDDFSEVKPNEHPGYENELLYVFGKDVRLTERFGDSTKNVSLYIKFNKQENKYVIVVSFHEQKFPLSYYFK